MLYMNTDIHTSHSKEPITFTIKDYPASNGGDGFHLLKIGIGQQSTVNLFLPWGADNLDIMSVREIVGAIAERRAAGA